MSISDDAPNMVVSGETTLSESMRMISPLSSAGGQRKKKPRTPKATASTPALFNSNMSSEKPADEDGLLNIAGIFQSIFPDLSENR